MSCNPKTFNSLWRFPRKDLTLLLTDSVLMAIKKINIKLYGSESWRPFISTQDISRLLITILKTSKDLVNRQIFNVGEDKENYRIIDIIHSIKKVTKN